jgi:hypothetical protein
MCHRNCPKIVEKKCKKNEFAEEKMVALFAGIAIPHFCGRIRCVPGFVLLLSHFQ